MNPTFEISKTITDLEAFFGIEAPDYEIVLATSREEFNKLTNVQHSEPWMAGWSNGYKIVVIHPDKLEELTEGAHHSDSHPKRIKHELAHLFYAKLTHGEIKPAWLNEGLAFYLDGRGGAKPKGVEDVYTAVRYFTNGDGQLYSSGSYIVKKLIEKYGKDKLLTLIRSIRAGLTESLFQELFQKVYDFKFTEDELEKNL